MGGVLCWIPAQGRVQPSVHRGGGQGATLAQAWLVMGAVCASLAPSCYFVFYSSFLDEAPLGNASLSVTTTPNSQGLAHLTPGCRLVGESNIHASSECRGSEMGLLERVWPALRMMCPSALPAPGSGGQSGSILIAHKHQWSSRKPSADLVSMQAALGGAPTRRSL